MTGNNENDDRIYYEERNIKSNPENGNLFESGVFYNDDKNGNVVSNIDYNSVSAGYDTGNNDIEKKRRKGKLIFALTVYLSFLFAGLFIFLTVLLYNKNMVNGIDNGETASVADYVSASENIIEKSYDDGIYVSNVYDSDYNFLYKMKYHYVVTGSNVEDSKIKEWKNYIADYELGDKLYFDEKERLESVVKRSGEVRLYVYKNSNPVQSSIIYNYPNGAIEKEYYDNSGNILSSRADYKDGAYSLGTYNKHQSKITETYDINGNLTDIEYKYYNSYYEQWSYLNGALNQFKLSWGAKNELQYRYYDFSEYVVSEFVDNEGSYIAEISADCFRYKYIEKKNGDWIKEVYDGDGIRIAKTQFFSDTSMMITVTYDAKGYVSDWYYSISKFEYRHEWAEYTKAFESVEFDENERVLKLTLDNGQFMDEYELNYNGILRRKSYTDGELYNTYSEDDPRNWDFSINAMPYHEEWESFNSRKFIEVID